MRNHAPASRSGSKRSDATRAFARAHEHCDEHDEDPLRVELDVLVGRAATMELHEGVEAERLRADVHVLIAQLVASGRLPAGTTIAPDDPLVVVIRMLAVVARKLDEAAAPRLSA